MILKSLKLNNFRGYKNIEIPFSQNLNVIIGRNDIGKSTILEALSIFFEDDTISIEQDDLNVHSSIPEITIEVSFIVDPTKEYLIDEDKRTSLQKECLTNGKNTLVVRKVWDCTKQIKASSLKTFIVAQYYSFFADNPLVTENITSLKKKAEEFKVIYNVKDKRAKSDLREAIYEHLKDKTLKEVAIQIDKEDTKKIYTSLCKDFPNYELFQSDRANKDSDKQVQDPLKIIVKRSINEIKNQLDDILSKINKDAINIGNKTIEKLKEMDPNIAATLKPNLKAKAWDSLFSFTFNGDEGIPFNKRGSGVRRLIMLNYFRADAEEKTSSTNGIIYAIEEPETSQHPNYQRMLIDSLITIANTENKQVIITTHSPEIAKICDSENLIFLNRSDDGTPILVTEEEIKMSSICETLGILPSLSRLVIEVEGEKDVKFLMNINQEISEFKSIIDLKKEKISIIPLIGGNLNNWIDRNYLHDSNVKEFLICDSDKGSKQENEHSKQVKQLKMRKNGSNGVLTQKRELENYISPEIYYEFFKIDFKNIKDWSSEDIPKYIFNKRNDLTESKIKSISNGLLSKKVTIESLKKIDAYDEVKGWFLNIKKLYDAR